MMKVETLYLSHFGRFDRQMFEFAPGLNVIPGDNFSGKTTVCDAIYFALFGRSMKDLRYVKKLIHHDQKKGAATLTLHCNGKLVTFDRHLPVNRSTISIDKGPPIDQFGAIGGQVRDKPQEQAGL